MTDTFLDDLVGAEEEIKRLRSELAIRNTLIARIKWEVSSLMRLDYYDTPHKLAEHIVEMIDGKSEKE